MKNSTHVSWRHQAEDRYGTPACIAAIYFNRINWIAHGFFSGAEFEEKK